MGEKLLAQRILALLRDTAGRKSARRGWRARLGGGPARLAVAGPHMGRRGRAGSVRQTGDGDTIDWDSLPAPRRRDRHGRARAGLAARGGSRSPRTCSSSTSSTGRCWRPSPASSGSARLSGAAPCGSAGAGADFSALLGRLAGARQAEAAARVRRSEALSLGLLWLGRDSRLRLDRARSSTGASPGFSTRAGRRGAAGRRPGRRPPAGVARPRRLRRA